MDDLGSTASNAVNDAPQPVVSVEAPAANDSPSTSARSALEKAFGQVNTDGGERPRQPDGKFAPKDAAQAAPKPAASPAQAVDAATATEHPATPATPVLNAPTRFTKQAQQEWANVPETVRVETERAITELTQGLDKYKQAHEAFEPLREFHDRAQKGGTSLKDALTAYVGMEDTLRSDPVSGVMAICQNMGINPQALAQALMGQPADVAPKGDTREVAALKAEFAALKNQTQEIAQWREAQEIAPIKERIEAFAKENDFFDLLRPQIVEELKQTGSEDFAAAYSAVLSRHPKLVAAIEANKAAQAATTKQPDAAQTRKASLSITGSPNGSNPGSRIPAGSPREAVGRAFQSLGLS